MWLSWIPNSLSLGNLCLGFIVFLMASSIPITNDIEKLLKTCTILILIAALLDGFDGFLARLLKVESSLGDFLDSLADMTTFGLAPGFLIYQIYLREMKIEILGLLLPIGMLVAAIYPMCAAYRLARFNSSGDKNVFRGLPSPISAIFLLFAVILVQPKLSILGAVTISMSLSLLMVSNITYSKPQATIQRHLNFVRILLLGVILAIMIIILGWYWAGISVLLLYIFSGILSMFLHLFQRVTN